MSAGPDPLSSRERDVLATSADGASIAAIARRLFLSDGAVRNYLTPAIQKTAPANRIEAVRAAERQGWL